ncbi:MAG TPA: S8 family serine peptidase, partial [Phycisphaerales bacterium]|nr:S8 family serine peptidase [Phycisphaerales bacterium]
MYLKRVLAAAGAALAICSVAAIAGPDNSGKLRGDLGEVLAQAGDGELVPVTIVMKAQAEPFDLNELRAMSKAERRDFVVGSLKQVAEGSQAGVIARLAQAENAGAAEHVNPLWLVNVVAARVTADVALEIAARNDVAYMNYDRPVGEEVFPTVPADGDVLSAIECGVQAMNAPSAWGAGYTGAGIVVGMIDTGTCITHPDIANQVWTNAAETPSNGQDDDGNGFVDDVHGWSWDFNGSNSNISDNNGHGSHTAGTVAGDGAQGTQCGMAPDAEIQTLKFYNDLAGESSVWNGMQYGVANGADVMSASLGWLHAWNPDRVTWRTLCENTFATGAVVVFAAGNEGSSFGIDSVRTPGDVPDMITVG